MGTAAAVFLGVLSSASFACADSVADFYRGKTLTIIVGAGAGGGYDLYARSMSQYLSRHLPGRPTIIVQNMPGASGRTAAAYLGAVAAKDGSVLGLLTDSIVNSFLLEDKPRYDLRTFDWIGRLNSYVGVGIASKTSGVRSVSDAMTKEVKIGGTAVDSTTALVPLLLNRYEKTKFKIVYGYRSSQDIVLALERGEVDASGIVGWEVLKANAPLRDSVNILYQSGLERHPDLADVPLMMDFATSAESKAILSFFAASATIGRSLVAPPGVPKDRVTALRRALDQVVTDPEFVGLLKKQGTDIDPATGERLSGLVSEVLATPRDIIAKARDSIRKD